MVTDTLNVITIGLTGMLIATGLAVVIPQEHAFEDDVNFCVGSGACSANAGDEGWDCGSSTSSEVVDCSWIK